MKNGVISKVRHYVIALIAIILIGVTLFGIFGFNQTADYKNSYQVKVSIDRKASGATEILEQSVEEFFESQAKVVSYATQVEDGGKIIILKLRDEVSEKTVADAKVFLQEKFDTAELNVKVDVEAQEIVVNNRVNWKIVLAAGIALVIILIYALIFEKLAGALAVGYSAIVSVITFLALMGITRLPASPFIVSSCLISMMLSSAMALTSVARYREEAKNSASEKLTFAQIVNEVSKKEKRKYILCAGIVAFVGIVLALCGFGYFIWGGAQIILAGASALFTAYFGAPLVWSAIKSKKHK